jgi:thioredoxin reductase (NADPH)
MRAFTRDVSVVASDLDTFSRADSESAVAHGIGLIKLARLEEPVGDDRRVRIIGADGRVHGFDSVYPVMGCRPETNILGVDVERDGDGLVTTDKHQRTSVRHLYAAGDIVNTLNQISVASGEAAIAATAIHQSLPHIAR